MLTISNAIGIAGAGAVLLAYVLLLAGKLRRVQRSFLLLNAFGSAGILCSLAFQFNLPAALIEAVWCAISVYGLVRLASKRGKPAP